MNPTAQPRLKPDAVLRHPATFPAMRVILQRVSEASVGVEGREIARIGRGYLLLVGLAPTDSNAVVSWMAEKVVGLRLFADEVGKMNLDIKAVGGELLVVSQFTLYGNAAKGRRPSFVAAAPPEVAIPLYQEFLSTLRFSGVPVAAGEFGADMQVSLVNDGPVTLQLERDTP